MALKKYCDVCDEVIDGHHYTIKITHSSGVMTPPQANRDMVCKGCFAAVLEELRARGVKVMAVEP